MECLVLIDFMRLLKFSCAGNVFDDKFVTELPKAVFKKPKLSDYSSSSTGKRNDNSYRPVFEKRSSSYKQLNSLGNGS